MQHLEMYQSHYAYIKKYINKLKILIKSQEWP